jgi:hypothetical protein
MKKRNKGETTQEIPHASEKLSVYAAGQGVAASWNGQGDT